MFIFQILVLISAIAKPCISSDYDEFLNEEAPNPTPFQDWDYLVYSQRWPITSCMEWEEKNDKNECTMPANLTEWNVHGVWPNKIGADGPFFCDSSIHFDPSQLDPIMPDLKEHWTNIEANTKADSFWKHEWSKHGTCAASLPQLNSVYNYFNQGLSWNRNYKLSDMLIKTNIVPSQTGYDVKHIYNSIKSNVGKNPIVECVIDSKSKQSLISEIRICFDKNLEIIDCNITGEFAMGGNILSNCNLQAPVLYLPEVPNFNNENSDDLNEVRNCFDANYEYRNYLLRLYGLTKFLIWFTS